MQPITYNIKLDVMATPSIPRIEFTKGDLGGSLISFSVFNNNKPLPLTGKTITITIKKPDNVNVVYDIPESNIHDDNVVDFYPDLNGLNVPGTIIFTFEIYDGLKRITSKRMQYVVVDSLNVDDDVASFKDYPILTRLISDVQQFDYERQTEFDGIKATYEQATKENTVIELTEARKGEVNLKAKIDKIDSSLVGVSASLNDMTNLKATKTEVEVERQRINQLQTIPTGSTTSDAALNDIKIGADGMVYDSPGDAVRGQVNNLNERTIYSSTATTKYIGDATKDPSYPFDCTSSGYIVAFNQGQAVKNIKAVSQLVYANTKFNVFLIDTVAMTYQKIGELINNNSQSTIIRLEFATPFDISETQLIGLANTESSKQVQILYNSSITDGNMVRFTASNGVLSDRRDLPQFSLWLQIEYADYVYTYINEALQEVNKTITNPLKNKNIAFLGDSFTANPDRYINKLIELSGLNAVNYGVGGTRMVKASPLDTTQNFEARYPSMSNDVDMVVVFGGTNDFGYGDYEYGTFTDGANPNKYTFYAGLHRLFSGIYNKYLGKPVLIITPCHRSNTLTTYPEYTVGADGTLTPVTSAIGIPLKKYVDAIKEVAQFYSFHVADAYSESGFNPIDNNNYMADGLHPSTLGAERLAKWMLPYIERSYMDIIGQ